MDVSFIGLGGMGKAMALNLLRAGHALRVWNRSAAPAQELSEQGARIAASPSEAFEADAIVSMLADDAAVRAVVLESGALARAGREQRTPRRVHVNMATVSVECAHALTRAHSEAGVDYVAAPVFGRSDVAEAGKLSIVAAGDAEAIARVQPLFASLGQRTWNLGGTPERANVVKIAGNFLLATLIEGLSESMTLGKAHGIPESELLDVLNGSLFPGPVVRNYGTAIARRAFEPAGFRLRLGLKDLRLALSAGEQANAPLPLASLVRDSLIEAIAHGDAERDWAALSRASFRRAGLGT